MDGSSKKSRLLSIDVAKEGSREDPKEAVATDKIEEPNKSDMKETDMPAVTEKEKVDHKIERTKQEPKNDKDKIESKERPDTKAAKTPTSPKGKNDRPSLHPKQISDIKETTGGVFKIPKEKLLSPSSESNKLADGLKLPKEKLISQDSKINEPSRLVSNESSRLEPAPPNNINQISSNVTSGSATPVDATLASLQASSAMLNKQIISNLNKSLKAKQKIINSKEPHPRNSSVISDIVNTSPKATSFPNGVSDAQPMEAVAQSSNDEVIPLNPPEAEKATDETKKSKQKKIAKQNSTRTDFFAAKLASAVDDVESSDSDETFVYENNPNDYANETINDNANDNASVQGSNDEPEEPNEQAEKDEEKPESIRSNGSGQSNPPKNAPVIAKQTAPSINGKTAQSTNGAQPYLDSSYRSNNYLDNLIQSRPLTTRQGSSLSFTSSMNDADNTLTNKNLNTFNSPSNNSYYSNSHLNNAASSFGINLHLSRAQSINDEAHFSYEEVEDEGEIDDLSTEGDNMNQINSNGSRNANYVNQQIHNNDNKLENSTVASTKASKKNQKSSNASSKLRSTTSKLFDKKGGQPRRYSTIPDDIDIEDFDDELIYYDNNIRFPYNGTNNNSANFNESSPLLNQKPGQPRIPHYRSLNLNFQGSKKPLKNKRYLSMGQPYTGNMETSSNNNANSDIFPFPYPETQPNFYYDLDEYDEETQYDQKFPSGQLHPHLSPNNNHFFLPRKVSRGSMRRTRMNYIKSLVYTLISIICILSIGFILGFVLASTKDLANVSVISIENPLVSQDELIFNVVVEAFNPGWFTVTIEDIEIDVFAKSGYLLDVSMSDINTLSTVETVLLGSVYNLETALEFEGGFFHRDPVQQTGTVRLLSPGKNLTNFASRDKRVPKSDFAVVSDSGNSTEPDNSKKWEIISRNPFDLIIRGILKYNLPMTKNVKSVVINKVGYVDPTQSN